MHVLLGMSHEIFIAVSMEHTVIVNAIFIKRRYLLINNHGQKGRLLFAYAKCRNCSNDTLDFTQLFAILPVISEL